MIITRDILDENVTTHYDRWVGDICRLVTEGNREVAVDILNDLLTTLYERISQNPIEIKNLDGYLYRAARYSYTSSNSSYQRKRDMYKTFVCVNEAIGIPLDETTDEDGLCFADIRQMLDESPFSWSESEIFLRKNLEGKTKAQMARELGVTRAKLNYRYNMVRNYLRDTIKFNSYE